jgi:broad specificity phosphatase PhoE
MVSMDEKSQPAVTRRHMDIYIIRHGQTDANLRHELQGRRDVPLNERGRKQARRVRAFLVGRGVSFDRVYSSPLERAVETARIVSGGGVPVETDNRLLEMDYGPYEGMDLREPTPEIVSFFSDFAHNPVPAGMEQLSFVMARAGRFLEDIVRTPGGAVLVSTHAILMKGILEYLTPESYGSYWSKFTGNRTVYRCGWSSVRFSVSEEVVDAGRAGV